MRTMTKNDRSQLHFKFQSCKNALKINTVIYCFLVFLWLQLTCNCVSKIFISKQVWAAAIQLLTKPVLWNVQIAKSVPTRLRSKTIASPLFFVCCNCTKPLKSILSSSSSYCPYAILGVKSPLFLVCVRQQRTHFVRKMSAGAAPRLILLPVRRPWLLSKDVLGDFYGFSVQLLLLLLLLPGK